MEILSIVSAGPYNLLYAGAFAIAVAATWRYGRMHGWPAEPWAVILATAVLGGILGSRILHFEPGFTGAGEKTVLGGIVGGALAVLAAARYLRFDGRVTDAFAMAVPLGLALGKVGCFLAGCCFGRPTDLPWATVYGPGTEPFAAQVASGLIAADAAASVPVHPVQLYEAGLVLALAGVVWLLRRGLRRPGGAFLLFCAGYAALRFGTEFFRFKTVGPAGLTATQSILGPAALLLGTVMVLRESSAARARSNEPRWDAEALHRTGHVVVLLAIAVVPLSGWLSSLETVVAAAGVVPPLLVLLRHAMPRHVVAAPALGIAVIGAFVQQSDTTGARTFVTLGAGAMAGRYQESCGGVHDYRVAGASVALTHAFSETRSATARATLFTGSDEEEDEPNRSSQTVDGFGLGGQYDSKYLGLGLGVMAGRLVIDGGPETVLPSVSLRIGTLRGFFVEGSFADHEPAPVPGPVVAVGIGHGLGTRGSNLRAGLSGSGIYGTGLIVLDDGFEIEPFVASGGSTDYNLGLFLRKRIGGGY